MAKKSAPDARSRWKGATDERFQPIDGYLRRYVEPPLHKLRGPLPLAKGEGICIDPWLTLERRRRATMLYSAR